ncbi:hypothetical protein DL93DRAFT_2027985, partial [Clavulina sp. PMI_390]
LPSQTSVEDPTRPGLFYHLVQTSARPVYAVSFLHLAPKSEQSKTVIGWLPATTETTSESSESAEEEAGLQDFVPNQPFLDILHTSIQKALEKGRDAVIVAEALNRESGWLHINDSRNVPALGRIGDPDDIIGTVLVEDGKVVPSTYQRMPSYRVCTSDGVTQLSEGLDAELRENLSSTHEAE